MATRRVLQSAFEIWELAHEQDITDDVLLASTVNSVAGVYNKKYKNEPDFEKVTATNGGLARRDFARMWKDGTLKDMRPVLENTKFSARQLLQGNFHSDKRFTKVEQVTTGVGKSRLNAIGDSLRTMGESIASAVSPPRGSIATDVRTREIPERTETLVLQTGFGKRKPVSPAQGDPGNVRPPGSPTQLNTTYTLQPHSTPMASTSRSAAGPSNADLAATLAQISQTLNGVTTRLDSIELGQNTVKTRLNKIETNMVSVETLGATQTQLKEDILEKVENDRAEHETRLRAVENRDATDVAKITNLVITNDAVAKKLKDAVKEECKDLVIEDTMLERIESKLMDAIMAKVNAEAAVKEAELTRLAAEVKDLKDRAQNEIFPTYTVIPEAEEYERGKAAYKRAVRGQKLGGLCKVILTSDEWYDTVIGEESTKKVPKKLKIEKSFGKKFKILADPTESRKGNPVFLIKFETTGRDSMFEFVNKLLSRRHQINGLTIQLTTPSAFDISRTLDLWVKADAIFQHDLTTRGFLSVFINDGDADIDPVNDVKKFKQSCTRIMPDNPTALAKLRLPSISNLRKIARGTHFVSSNGCLIKFPSSFKRRKAKKFGTNYGGDEISDRPSLDEADETSDTRMRKFLMEQGLLDES